MLYIQYMFNFPDLSCQADNEKWLGKYRWSLSSLPDVHFRGWLSLLWRPRPVAPTPQIGSGKDMAGVADAKTEAWTFFFVKRDGMKLKSPNFWEFEENFWVLVLKFFAKIWDVLNKKVSAFGKQTNNFLRRTGSPTCFIWVKRSDDFSKMYSFLSQYQIITPTEWIYFGSVCCDIICQEEHFFVNSCQCLLPWMLQLYF